VELFKQAQKSKPPVRVLTGVGVADFAKRVHDIVAIPGGRQTAD
jgi:hypothetical protein